MATVTGLTAARMLAIEAASIVDGEVSGDDLILTKQSGTTINAGNVRGPKGDTGAPGADGGTAGFLKFSSFAGANDDAKLVNAVAAVSAMTYKPTVVLDENRLYTFNNQHPTPPDGWHLSGPIGSMAGNAELTTRFPLAAKVKINYSGTWINLTTEKWNIRYSNISFEGNSGCTWLNAPNVSEPLWVFQAWNLCFNMFYGVLGNASNKCYLAAARIWGWWDVGNSYNTAFHIGGSDNDLFLDGLLLDSGITSGVADGTPHFYADYLSKTVLGPIYCTSRNNWTGLLVAGSATNGHGLVQAPGSRWEGKNQTEFCRGATIRVNSGSLTLMGASVNFGMGATNARSDAGTIHHAGGTLYVIGCNHSRGDNTTVDTPFIYSTGGTLSVLGTEQSTQGGLSWTDKPLVYVGASSNLIAADASVRISPIKERPVRVYSDATAPTNPQVGDLHFT